MTDLSNYKFSKDHEWALISANTATIGITDHAQSSLGDIVFVDLPKVGKKLSKGDTFGVVESIKAVSDLFSPVDGEVTEINDTVISEPNLLNSDPMHSGWLIKIKLSAGSETPLDLLNQEEYQSYIKTLS